MTTSKQLINQLGGTAKLARFLGIPKPTVQAWHQRGIPPKYLLSHAKMFRKAEKEISSLVEK
jgi:hypothetical protein